jgi:hypothetical protein
MVMPLIPQGYYDATRAAESGGNPYAKASTSSATGLYQFLDGTWMNLMNKYPQLGLTKDGRTDPDQQQRAMQAFTQDNARVLQAKGIEISKPSLYAAHFLGAGGATQVLSAPDSDPVSRHVSAGTLKANPFLGNMTVADFKNWAAKKTGAGASETSNNMNPFEAVFAQQPQAAQQQASPGILAQVQQGGLGALFGAPNGVFHGENGQPGYDLGRALTGAGAAIASINSPSQGAALAQLMPAAQRNEWSATFDPNTGTVLRFNKRTGQVETSRAQGIAPKADAPAKVDAAILKKVDEDVTEKYGGLYSVSQDAAKFQEALQNGELDISIAGRGQAAWENLFGKSSPKTRLYNEFAAFQEKLRNASLRLNTGVQTEGDAQRAANEFLAGMGKFDNATAAQQLANVLKHNRTVIETAPTLLRAASANYNNPRVFAPYEERLGGMIKFFQDLDEKQKAKTSAPAQTQGSSGGYRILNVR